MTADTFGVVGGHITTSSGLVLLDAIDSILWAVNDTVVTLETHAAAHASAGFLSGFFFSLSLAAFLALELLVEACVGLCGFILNKARRWVLRVSGLLLGLVLYVVFIA